MKIPSLLSMSDNTFKFYEDVKGLEKFYIDEEIKLVNATITIHDPRYISHEQRKKWFALIRDISLYTGYEVDYLHILFKTMYSILNDKENISMSNVDMTTAKEMIDMLLKWCFDFGIPLNKDTGELFKGEEQWTYYCLKTKICCICGQKADEHHQTNLIGMGHDRQTKDDSNSEKLPLCRIHHSEAHTIGLKTFEAKYHVKPILFEE